MLTEGKPRPHNRQSQSICGAPVARFGAWVGPFGHQSLEEQGGARPIHSVLHPKYVATWMPRSKLSCDDGTGPELVLARTREVPGFKLISFHSHSSVLDAENREKA